MNDNEMLKDYPDILTVPQVCEVLHVGKGLVYQMLTNKELYSVKVGRSYRVPKKAILTYIYGQKPLRVI